MSRETVIKLAKKWYDIISFPEKFDGMFDKLLEEEKDLEYISFDEYDIVANVENKGKNLIMFLSFCEELSKRYKTAGIPDEILLATIEDFIINVEREYILSGKMGLVKASILQNHFSMRLFRIAEETVDGQAIISEAGTYLIQNVNKEKVYSLFESALALAQDSCSRNNVRMMRMVFRYSELQVKCIPDENGKKKITDAERSELWYMHDNFDSYLNNKREGFAIAIDVKSENVHRADVIFVPDKWYLFE